MGRGFRQRALAELRQRFEDGCFNPERDLDCEFVLWGDGGSLWGGGLMDVSLGVVVGRALGRGEPVYVVLSLFLE